MSDKLWVSCIGTQNTGKTTFIKDFIKANPSFNTPAESYRDVVKAQKLKINRNGTIAHQWIIFNCLVAMYENYAQPRALLDRSPLDAYIYTVYIAKGNKGIQEMLATSLSMFKRVDVIFWFPLKGNEDIQLKRDTLRDIDPDYRNTIDGMFAEHLQAYKDALPPILPIVGDRQTRIITATEYINDNFPDII